MTYAHINCLLIMVKSSWAQFLVPSWQRISGNSHAWALGFITATGHSKPSRQRAEVQAEAAVLLASACAFLLPDTPIRAGEGLPMHTPG